MFKRTLVTMLGIAALAGALTGCKGGGDKDKALASPQPVLTVRVRPAEMRNLGDSLVVTGAIAAWQAVPVSAQANGLQVLEVKAEEGDRVRKGQVLATLDNRLLQAQAADARARLATAIANARDAQFNYDRYAALRREGGVTGPEMSQRATALASANGSVAQAKAGLAQFQVQLAQTQVLAPTDGVVLQRSVQIGDVASVGRAMFTLARNGRLEMDGNVAEADLGRVRVGQTAVVRSNAVPGMEARGKVFAISPSLNATSRLATARIDVPAGAGFRVGMFATATIDLGRRTALVVPADAVTSREGQSIVFIAGPDGVVHARPVTAGDAQDGWTPIRAGLSVGDRVVTDGVGFLKEGDRVTVAGLSPLPGANPSMTPASAAPITSPPPARTGSGSNAAPSQAPLAQPSMGAPIAAPSAPTRPSPAMSPVVAQPSPSLAAPSPLPSVAVSQGPVNTRPVASPSVASLFQPSSAPGAP